MDFADCSLVIIFDFTYLAIISSSQVIVYRKKIAFLLIFCERINSNIQNIVTRSKYLVKNNMIFDFVAQSEHLQSGFEEISKY